MPSVKLLLAFVIAAGLTVAVQSPVHASTCGGSVSLSLVGQACAVAGSPGTPGSTTTSTVGGVVHVITYGTVCVGTSQICAPPTCTTGNGEAGVEQGVYTDGQFSGVMACVTPQEVTQPGKEPTPPSPGQVLQAARRLHWPEATLLIQPPNGETLVNFATNFYSTSTQPITRTVTLV